MSKKIKGAPKKPDSEIKKNRCVRVCDDDLELIFEKRGQSLQEFVDFQIKQLKRKKKNETSIP